MFSFRTQQSSLGALPLTRENLRSFIAGEQKKMARYQALKSVLLLGLSGLIFTAAAFVVILYFYNASISISKKSWVEVKNLTPIMAVETKVKGTLEQVFVSQGQIVQKGELLGVVQTDSTKLDYQEARKDFADKIVELHCLISLQLNRSVFKLPYDAQLLVDQMAGETDFSYSITQCERELLRNVMADQSLEEAIGSLEDQSRLLKNVVKLRKLILNPSDEKQIIAQDTGGNNNQTALASAYRDQYFPMMQLAQVQQELQGVRKEYFLRKLQKGEDLAAAIKQTMQEIRYLDKRIRELKNQMDDNYIYAAITGTVLGPNISQVGSYFKERETVFNLQPIENIFQVSVSLDEEDSGRFSIGSFTTVSLEENQENPGLLKATTVAVVRKPNGKLEAVLDLDGNAKKNSEVILASGYIGEGLQRLRANITTGQNKIWKSISNIILGSVAASSI
jgi:multidrug efflux pump subunit AcrA (membrane-fusion protein)